MQKANFYDGQPVKRMRRVEGGILLIFFSAVRGQQGRQATIQQEDWDALGEVRDVESNRAADLRKLVRT